MGHRPCPVANFFEWNAGADVGNTRLRKGGGGDSGAVAVFLWTAVGREGPLLKREKWGTPRRFSVSNYELARYSWPTEIGASCPFSSFHTDSIYACPATLVEQFRIRHQHPHSKFRKERGI
jgi:hypothetical protein